MTPDRIQQLAAATANAVAQMVADGTASRGVVKTDVRGVYADIVIESK